MNGLWQRAALLLWCILLLPACDATSPEPAPFVVPEVTVESTEPVTTSIPIPATSTPAPPITPVSKPLDGKYLFIEISYDAAGSGNLPRQVIEFPTYAFDPAKGTLSPTQYSRGRPIAPRAGDWGLVGAGSRRSGAAGQGSGNGLERLSALPFNTNVTMASGQATDNGEATRKALVKLQGAASDGRVEAVIDGERVVLAPGAHWQRTFSIALKTATHDGHYDLTSTVTNYGWLDQTRIQSTPKLRPVIDNSIAIHYK